MRRNLQQFLFACMIAFTGTASAQISEGFEPSGQGSLSVRDELIMNNWLLPDMDVNPEGSMPINGATSMGSGPSYKPDQTTGIVTPFLSFNGGTETVSFSYTLHRQFSSECRRWFLVYVGSESSDAVLVDSVEITSSMSVVNYSKQLSGFTGNKVVYINVKGEGCNSKFIMDNFTCTASNANINHPAGLIINGNPIGGGNLSDNPIDPQANVNINAPSVGLSISENGFYRTDNPDNGTINEGVSLYPNPANNQVNLKFSSASNQFGQVEVYNINGSKIYSQPATINAGVNTVNINIADLTAGNYFVSLVTNEGTTSKRFTRIQ